ncbi:MAG: aminopeptidase P N-terminal domain-containing protein [Acholeplasmatales bacterium]|jgi:Xaa-Pro aminopeptidase|nr:aminopeptidase P N-terminal domain-containing protein [Acholeplasmatales bacterium]
MDYLTKRRDKFSKLLLDDSVVVLYAGSLVKKSEDQYYDFSVNRNFYYLFNIDQDSSISVIIKSGNTVFTHLFIKEDIVSLWVEKSLSKEEASELSNIEIKNIHFLDEFYPFLSSVLEISRRSITSGISNIYFDIAKNEETNQAQIMSKYPYLVRKEAYSLITSLRRYKDKEEIFNIETAISITKEAIENAVHALANGICEEKEVEAFYNFILNLYGLKPSFETIMASGENATTLHYTKNDSEISEGSLLLCDLGVCYKNYASDISRTYPSSGKFSPRQKEIYEIVLKANKETIAWVKPGVSFKEFLDFGKDILAKECVKIGLINEESEISKYYYHGLGHYLGLDVHDVGLYNTPFKEGIVITVEPGLYIKEEKIGIRIEDDILITKDGCRVLSKDIEKEVDDIEKLMEQFKL